MSASFHIFKFKFFNKYSFNNFFYVLAAIQKDTSKSFLLKDEQNHADPEFYENLPFNKLRNPPKQVTAVTILGKKF